MLGSQGAEEGPVPFSTPAAASGEAPGRILLWGFNTTAPRGISSAGKKIQIQQMNAELRWLCDFIRWPGRS